MGSMADLIFSTIDEIDRLVTAENMEVATYSIAGTILRWMETASIAIDRNGRLVRLQERSRSGLELIPPQEADIRSRVDKASCNLAHTGRMLSSDGTAYLTAIDLRLLYQLSDLMADYFVVRGVPWRGEKAAVRYWRAHHREFLDLVRVCMAETDRFRKVELYGKLATMTMAPAGGLWGDGHTGLWLVDEPEMTADSVQEAMVFWETLIDD